MSLVDRVRRLSQLDREAYTPVLVGGHALGLVSPRLAGWLLAERAEVARDEAGRLVLAGDAEDEPTRSERLCPLWAALHEQGWIPAWRGEALAIHPPGGGAPVLHMERGAVDVLGLPARGTHLNGYVRTPTGLEVWVARRAADKATFPGLLDHLAAGGLPAGLDPVANMAKEAAEEAGVPAELFARARPGPTLAYACTLPWGVRQDTLFTFDLELPADWSPVPADGEVAGFERWPVARVLHTMRTSTAFKFNVPPVLLASLLARGALDHDPEHAAIAECLSSLMVE